MDHLPSRKKGIIEMKNLYQILPAFAPDYSGVSSILFEMDILTVFIDPHGCNGQTLHFSEPRYYKFHCIPKSFSFSAKEVDAITGVDTLLIRKIKAALANFSAKAIVLVGAPVSMIISTDFRALEGVIESETGLPVISVDTNGLHNYEDGQKKILKRLIEKFTGSKRFPDAPVYDVHILGATPLDNWDDTAICDYICLLEECGARSAVCWGHGGDLEAISSADKAKLLVAVSTAGIYAARLLSQKYGIPYIAGFPVGRKRTESFQQYLRSFFSTQDPSMLENLQKDPSIPKEKERILIISDQINGNALRSCLRQEFRYEEVHLATYFSLDPIYAERKDRTLLMEHSLTNDHAKYGPYDFVIGDPVYRSLLPSDCRYLSNPHLAVSGILYWNEYTSYFAEKGTEFLRLLLS